MTYNITIYREDDNTQLLMLDDVAGFPPREGETISVNGAGSPEMKVERVEHTIYFRKDKPYASVRVWGFMSKKKFEDLYGEGKWEHVEL